MSRIKDYLEERIAYLEAQEKEETISIPEAEELKRLREELG